MSPAFYEIYTVMLYEYRNGLRIFRPGSSLMIEQDRGSLRLIEQVIQESCDRRSVTLRPDAKYFLILNFHQMVAVPTKIVLHNSRRDEISKLIQSDIDFIISAAINHAKNSQELSGGTIIRTVAEVWDKLKINAEDIWS